MFVFHRRCCMLRSHEIAWCQTDNTFRRIFAVSSNADFWSNKKNKDLVRYSHEGFFFYFYFGGIDANAPMITGTNSFNVLNSTNFNPEYFLSCSISFILILWSLGTATWMKKLFFVRRTQGGCPFKCSSTTRSWHRWLVTVPFLIDCRSIPPT